MPKRGRFITLEGGEGAGKSTQVQLLKNALEAAGKEVLVTREPGGSTGAEEIRELLVNGEPGRWDGMTEALLNFAARRDHMVKTVWPAIDLGVYVISDRYADSTIAYQGYGHGLDKDMLFHLWDIAVGGYRPDLTYVLDLPVEMGLNRALGRGDGEDRYEKMALNFHGKLKQGFLELAALEPERCCVINADRSIDEIHADMCKILQDRLRVILS